MIQNILTFCVKNDLTFVDGSLPSGKLVANDINRNSIYLITPFDNAVVKANFQTNLQSDKPTSVLGFLVDGHIEVKEIVSENATYYPLVKDWHIYEFKVPSNTLQFISRNRTGQIGINFSIEQRLIPAIKHTYGIYGGEVINGVGINTPQSEKYYYINKTIGFNHNGIDFDLNDIVVDDTDNLVTYKISAYSNRGSTPTSMFSVDPSVLNDNFETVEPSLTSQIVSQVNENVNDIVLILQAIGVSDATLVNFGNRISVAEQDIDNIEQDIYEIENGTTVVGKASSDANGDDFIRGIELEHIPLHPSNKYNLKLTNTKNQKVSITSLSTAILSYLPKATDTINGLMSANDKSKVDALWALLDNNDENFVDTINELLEIFENYPESMDIVTEFAKKVDKTTTVNGKPLSSNIVLGADEISYENTISGLSSTNVKTAIDELSSEKADSFTLTNLVSNGDFLIPKASPNQNEPLGFTFASATNISLTDGIVKFTATAASGYFRSATPVNWNGTDLLYRFARIKAGSNSVGFGSNGLATSYHSGSGNFEIIGEVIGLPGRNTNVYLAVSIYDYRTSGWTPIEVDYIGYINLTETFGAGKEPTQEQMDAIIKLKGYFQQTSIDLKDLLIIDKYQEARLTPTLTNATTTYLTYRKDDLGYVDIVGNLTITTFGTNLTLPLGYRPLTTLRIPVVSSTGTFGFIIINTDGTIVSTANVTIFINTRFATI